MEKWKDSERVIVKRDMDIAILDKFGEFILYKFQLFLLCSSVLTVSRPQLPSFSHAHSVDRCET